MISADHSSCAGREHERDGNGDILAVPLTDAERIEYQKAAERCGLSLVAWIRSRLYEAAKREAKEG
jgi:hypothetical protein